MTGDNIANISAFMIFDTPPIKSSGSSGEIKTLLKK